MGGKTTTMTKQSLSVIHLAQYRLHIHKISSSTAIEDLLVTGMDVVFHCATMAPSADNTRSKELAYAVNVAGTENVIKACQMEHVRKLVYTSSASVVFDGHDLNDVDESASYAAKPLDYYTQTKVPLHDVQTILTCKGILQRQQQPTSHCL